MGNFNRHIHTKNTSNSLLTTAKRSVFIFLFISKLNEVIGEKLIDVLLHTCSQLVLNSPPEILNITNQVPSHLLFYFDEITLEQMNSTSSRKGTNESLLANKFSLLISERIKESDHLFYYIIICLDLFVRFNDGSHNCVFTVCSKTNSLYILNDFCDTLFNKSIDGNISFLPSFP